MTIDPNTLNTLTSITLNVASNGLTSLLAFSGHKAKELVVGKDFLEQQELDKTALAPILQQAIQDAAEHAPWNAPKGTEIASLFLLSPEAEELVRQIYAMEFGSTEKPNDFTLIRTTFIELLKHYADAYQPDLLPDAQQLISAANTLFDALLQACNLLLDKAIDKGVLAAHEAKDSFRYNIINSQLIAIQKELELLQSSKEIDVKAILDFEKQYRKQVAHPCSYITPPNLQSARKHPIDSLYVSPSVTTFERKGRGEKRLDRNEFFACAYRAVVLGNPGAGKSTMAIKLCHDLASDDTQRLFAGRQLLTPILVTLRVYGADKQKTECSLLDFIETEAKKIYQLPIVPSHAFHYLLNTGRTMVIFDGLDELLDTSYRQEIRNDVELFCQLYPSVPVLITSREVGYEQAPLDENLFEVYRLAPFGEKQVEEYVHKWFTLAETEDISTTPRQRLGESFLTDSQIVPDLRSNPLMLALLCTIYRQDGYIPRYRPDVYEKCAIMLFERWDKSRNIYAPPLPEEHVRPLIEYLAHWIYADAQLRAGITETTLVQKATIYLHEELYEDRHKAERVAREFIAFCTGRAWVFIDTGTQKDGENLYQFAHATFLEYFAASHLVRASRSSSSLLKVLLPHIAKQEWDVMAQLAFQLYSKQNAGASDELLMALVKQSQSRTGQGWFNILSFAVRCLQFIIPRPYTRRAIIETCVKRCIAWGSNELDKGAIQYGSSPYKGVEYGMIFNNFTNMVTENYITIKETLRDLLIEYVNSHNDHEAIIALEIAIYIGIEGFSKRNDIEVRKLADVSKDVLEVCAYRIQRLYPKSILLSLNQVWEGKLYVEDFVKLYGLRALLTEAHFVICGNTGLQSIIGMAYIFHYQFIKQNKQSDILRRIGANILSSSSPIISNNDRQYVHYSISLDNITPIGDEHSYPDKDILFGLFTLFAIVAEVKIKLPNINNLTLHKSKAYILYFLLFARFLPPLHSHVQEWLDECHFTQQQQDFIWRWIRKEISLVAPDETNQDDNQEQP